MSETNVKKKNPWKWIIPSGCLAFVLICAGCLIAPFYGVYAALTGSEFYDQALQEMNNSQELKAALGDPIEHSPGWKFQGNINVNNDAGDADMTFPVKGSQGSGSANVVARRAEGAWTIESLTVDVAGQGVVTLIPRTVAAETTPETPE